MTTETHDAIIVGAGIAGSALAAALAKGGLDVLLLEKSESYADRVRGEALTQWGVLEARNLGLLGALEAAGGHYVGRMVGYDEVFPPEAAEAASIDMSMFAPNVAGLMTIPHPAHCQALFDAAAAAGAKTWRGVDVEEVAGASPRVTFATDGERREARARIVIGADGRPSAVREALGIPLHAEPPRGMLAGLFVEGAESWDDGGWTLGTEGDLAFAIFPMGAGRARLYGFWGVDQRQRFAGHHGAAAFLDAFKLDCCPKASAFSGARPAGPMLSFFNNETWAETPAVEGAVLAGDAAGWTDPIIGCGLASAYRDARMISEVMLGSTDWSAAAFTPYADERRERHRRLRFISDLTTELFCAFGEAGKARRFRFLTQSQTEPGLLAHIIANLAGPEAQPPEVYTPKHRAYVLGSP